MKADGFLYSLLIYCYFLNVTRLIEKSLIRIFDLLHNQRIFEMAEELEEMF